MLSMYLAFLYSGRNYYDLNRILCMSNFLYKVQERNRLQQKGVLKRFSIDCYGYQETIEDMRSEKMKMYEELKVNIETNKEKVKKARFLGMKSSIHLSANDEESR